MSDHTYFKPGKVLEGTKLTILGPAFINRYGARTWKLIDVMCECGREMRLTYPSLYRHGPPDGFRFSCGCSMRVSDKVHSGRPRVDLSGRIFGRLTVLSPGDRLGSWLCSCTQCGGTHEYHGPANRLTVRGDSACDDSTPLRQKQYDWEVLVFVQRNDEGSMDRMRVYTEHGDTLEDACRYVAKNMLGVCPMKEQRQQTHLLKDQPRRDPGDKDYEGYWKRVEQWKKDKDKVPVLPALVERRKEVVEEQPQWYGDEPGESGEPDESEA